MGQPRPALSNAADQVDGSVHLIPRLELYSLGARMVLEFGRAYLSLPPFDREGCFCL